MKKTIIAISLVITLLFSSFALSSCVLFEDDKTAGNQQNSDSGGENTDKGTSDTTINVEGGDNYNVNITPTTQQNILAASKSVLSAVSVDCTFERNRYNWSGAVVGTTTSAASGAGVIYKLDKTAGTAYVITNFHVIYDAYCNTANKISDNITLYLYGQEATKYAIPAKYVGGSMNYDLAVLKVENSQVLIESNAMEATVANSDDISILETAIAVGNPEGIGISATVGHINVDSENITIAMTVDGYSRGISLRCIRIDAAVNSGNSGGGLFNDKGELIGIVNAKLSDSSVDNIGYAIPSNVAKAIADNIIDYCDGTDKESVFRCMLGVGVGATAASTKYDVETGKIHKLETVVISSIEENSPVSELLKEMDIVNSITIDGVKHNVTRTFHVIDSMLNARVGSSVIMNITRNGETFDVTIPITEDMLTAY